MSSWFSKNFWLKVVAFVLAVIVWSYAREELRHTPGYKAEKATNNEIPTYIPQR